MTGIDIGIPMTPEQALAMLEKLKDKASMDCSVEGHYGFTQKQFEQFVGEILKDLFISDCLTDVLDKHFPDGDAENRLKVFAFALAFLYSHKGFKK